MANPKRSVLRWHGGKWKLAPWIIEQFPPHVTYVEPYGGGANVLMRKPRSRAEVYNDLDGDAVNIFRVPRGPRAPELVEAVRMTPFARSEFELAYEVADDEVERARRLLIRAFMGFGSNGHARRTGFRSKGYRSGTLPQHCWATQCQPLEEAVERLRGVVIENQAAMDVINRYDAPTTLFYVDPPYLPETRDGGTDYRFEMTDADHVALLERLRRVEGAVVLSGYAAPLYDDALLGWRRLERASLADGALERIEVLWCNRTPIDEASMPLWGAA